MSFAAVQQKVQDFRNSYLYMLITIHYRNTISTAWLDYLPETNPVIEQYNYITLNKTRTYKLSPVYVTENGIRKLYETSARFLFVKKDGSKLYAIKNIRQYYNKNYWTIETFSPGNGNNK